MSLDPEYVAARRVLLHALEALGRHLKALVLVGAQAVYLRVGEGDFAVPPYTTDADIAIDPRRLDDEPELASSLRHAGFELVVTPGTWELSGVQVDFLVPATLGGPGRRGARLGPHGNDVARKATGLEAAVVDLSVLRIEALESADTRAFDMSVAGVGALLVAKLHKIGERRNDANRLSDKDAFDVLRLLRQSESAELASTLSRLESEEVSRAVTRNARKLLQELFGDRTAIGALMAARSGSGLVDEVQITLSCELLARELLSYWR